MAYESLRIISSNVLSGLKFFIDIVVFVLSMYGAWFMDFCGLLVRKRKNVSGQTIVITGGAQGLGYSMARLFAIELGAKVAILDINEELVKKSAKKIRSAGGEAFGFGCDVSDSESLKNAAKEIKEHYFLNDPDIVVCNAGIAHVAMLHDLTEQQIRKTIEVNILGCFWTIRTFLNKMIERNSGHVVAVGSIGSHFGDVYGSAYCASKFAVRGLMESVEAEMTELGKNGIKFTTLYCWYTETKFLKDINYESRLFSIRKPDEAAKAMVDAILREKVESWIPSYLFILSTFGKAILTYTAKLTARKLFTPKLSLVKPDSKKEDD